MLALASVGATILGLLLAIPVSLIVWLLGVPDFLGGDIFVLSALLVLPWVVGNVWGDLSRLFPVPNKMLREVERVQARMNSETSSPELSN